MKSATFALSKLDSDLQRIPAEGIAFYSKVNFSVRIDSPLCYNRTLPFHGKEMYKDSKRTCIAIAFSLNLLFKDADVSVVVVAC